MNVKIRLPLSWCLVIFINSTVIIVAIFCMLLAEARGATAFSVRWIDGANETNYQVERSVNKGSYQIQATLGVNSTSWVDYAIVAKRRYCYRVRASNIAGQSAPSLAACRRT